MEHSGSDIAVEVDAPGAHRLNARAWISIEVSRDIELDLDDVCFITGFEGIPVYGGRVVDAADLSAVPAAAYELFEPVRGAGQRALRLREAHGRILLHAWGDPGFTLPAGCTRATLCDDDRLLQLRCGDVLLLEQVLGASGLPADADPRRRHAVRLTQVEAIVDPLNGRELLAVEWHAEDRLPFALPVALQTCAGMLADLSVARANVVLADHGRSIREALLVQQGGRADGRVRLPLSHAPLTVAEPGSGAACASSAAVAFQRDPLGACAPVSGVAVASDEEDGAPPALLWEARASLEASGPDDRHFVVKLCAGGYAELLFGDGRKGARLAPGTVFIARYRVGKASAGAVARDALAYMVVRGQRLPDIVIAPRNPLAALRCADGGGGQDTPAWQRAACYGSMPELAAAALRHPCVRQAAAWRAALGEDHTVHLAADLRDSLTPAPTVRRQLEAMLTPFMPGRHVLRVRAAVRVPIALGLSVRLLPGARRDEVVRELVSLFGERETACGRLAFFHPERRRLGQPVYTGSILALAGSVAGVDTVAVARLARLDACMDGGAGAGGRDMLAIGPGEITVLDAECQSAQRGMLEIRFAD